MTDPSEPFDTGPDAPSLAAQMDARGWPHPPVIGGETAARLIAAVDAAMPICGRHSKPHRFGGVLGPCTKPPGHGEWHLDAVGAAWAPDEGEATP